MHVLAAEFALRPHAWPKHYIAMRCRDVGHSVKWAQAYIYIYIYIENVGLEEFSSCRKHALHTQSKTYLSASDQACTCLTRKSLEVLYVERVQMLHVMM